LTKAELLMIFNLHPQNLGLLDCVVEELDGRFPEEQQEEMLAIITEVLGDLNQAATDNEMQQR
jgi:RNA polymerase Rpb4